MVGRLEKNVIIARSGVYDYAAYELVALKLADTIPDQHKGLQAFSVYRPAIVIAGAKDKFVKLPLTKEHPGQMVDGSNFRDLAMGWTGDTADVVVMPDSQEIGIQSTVNLVDDAAIEYYDSGIRDVSPGYYADFEWQDGISPDGMPYQIIMKTVHDVNHLAFTAQGRGGQGVAMDSDSQKIITDSLNIPFRQIIEDIVAFRNEYDESEIKEGVNALLDLISKIPETYKEKAILTRIVKDFYNVGNAFTGDEAAKEAAGLVADRYEALDAEIMEDNAMLFGKNKGKATDSEPEPEVPAPAPAPNPVPEPAPEAPVPEPAPAPVVAAAMEVSAMPDDISSASDEELRSLLNGLIKFAKSIAPGESQEPQHQEAPTAPAQDDKPEPEEEEKPISMDSLFRQPLGGDKKQTQGIADFIGSLKGRK